MGKVFVVQTNTRETLNTYCYCEVFADKKDALAYYEEEKIKAARWSYNIVEDTDEWETEETELNNGKKYCVNDVEWDYNRDVIFTEQDLK